MVTERVPWTAMCETLNQKFMAEVQTTNGLCKEHYFFLAQKIFGDSSARPEDFQNLKVSWAQFNKVTQWVLEDGRGSGELGSPRPHSCLFLAFTGGPSGQRIHILAVV